MKKLLFSVTKKKVAYYDKGCLIVDTQKLGFEMYKLFPANTHSWRIILEKKIQKVV